MVVREFLISWEGRLDFLHKSDKPWLGEVKSQRGDWIWRGNLAIRGMGLLKTPSNVLIPKEKVIEVPCPPPPKVKSQK